MLGGYSDADREMAAKLEGMFAENGWNRLRLTHPSDDSLCVDVTPCVYDQPASGITGAKDVEFFLMDSPNLVLTGSNDILGVAKTFNNLPQLVKQDADEKAKFQSFYDEHVAGHTEAQMKLASDVSHAAYDGWYDALSASRHSVSLSDYFDAHVSDIAVSKRLPEGVVKDAFALSENLSFCSDWSKDLYGHRIRDYGVVLEERDDKLFGGLHASEYEAAFLKEHPECGGTGKKSGRALPVGGAFDDEPAQTSDDFVFED